MAEARLRQIKEIFQGALERTPAERGAFLDAACGGDEVLRNEVEQLLATHARRGEDLDAPTRRGPPPPARERVPDPGPSAETSPLPIAELPTKPRARAAGPAGGSPSARSRFTPGTMLGRRYRIVARLGSGGMGELYRADDLKLSQAVALKFLPPGVVGDPESLARLHEEVRIAREIAHPHVCRTYDVAEVDGEHFISMEYVDGEDLDVLLRRIGRLPQDKALQIAGQLCGGLAAAHEKGVIHRDLKPANIMLDARGHVRITDFGIAAVVGEGGRCDCSAGTPAYMAPEQLRGEGTSCRSDIYSLGLVIYEIFTGHPALFGRSIEEISRRQESTQLLRMSNVVDDVDPDVERVVLRCLEKDPAERPHSALAVVSALPGKDPRAMIFAAAETPSPEMVAAAAAPGSIPLRRALAYLSLLVISVGASMASLAGLQRSIDPKKGPAALADDARQILSDLDIEPKTAEAYGFFWPTGPPRPTSFEFWYRGSPTAMVPSDPVFYRGDRVTLTNPPPGKGGVSLTLEPGGGLTSFQVLGDPGRSPRQYDRASLSGRVDLAERFREQDTGASAPALRSYDTAVVALILAFFVIGGVLARRNLRLKRADRRGATRVAVFLFVTHLLYWLLHATHHVVNDLSISTLTLDGFSFVAAVSSGLFRVVFVWVVYLALEPFIRKLWPDRIISWSRLLSGRLSDPLVGRDVLHGTVVAGVSWLLIALLVRGAGGTGPFPGTERVFAETLLSARNVVAVVCYEPMNAVSIALGLMFLLVILRTVLPTWLAVSVFGVIWVALNWLDTGEDLVIGLPAVALLTVASILLVYRCGFLSVVVFLFCYRLLRALPMTLDLSAWYAPSMWTGLAALGALAGYGFWVATRGQSIFVAPGVPRPRSAA